MPLLPYFAVVLYGSWKKMYHFDSSSQIWSMFLLVCSIESTEKHKHFWLQCDKLQEKNPRRYDCEMHNSDAVEFSSILWLFEIYCAHVLITHHSFLPWLILLGQGNLPPNFWNLTKATFSSKLLFFIIQLQGKADLLRPLHCLPKTTY